MKAVELRGLLGKVALSLTSSREGSGGGGTPVSSRQWGGSPEKSPQSQDIGIEVFRGSGGSREFGEDAWELREAREKPTRSQVWLGYYFIG